jgi:hypothetical protein
VGSARSAILLLERIEHFIGSALFSNPEIQIQVCSPGRLGARRSALLAIGFYLGSDTLRRYTLGDLATSFSENQHYPRGRRLVLYDAEGDFDRNFDWWKEIWQASPYPLPTKDGGVLRTIGDAGQRCRTGLLQQ